MEPSSPTTEDIIGSCREEYTNRRTNFEKLAGAVKVTDVYDVAVICTYKNEKGKVVRETRGGTKQETVISYFPIPNFTPTAILGAQQAQAQVNAYYDASHYTYTAPNVTDYQSEALQSIQDVLKDSIEVVDRTLKAEAMTIALQGTPIIVAGDKVQAEVTSVQAGSSDTSPVGHQYTLSLSEHQSEIVSGSVQSGSARRYLDTNFSKSSLEWVTLPLTPQQAIEFLSDVQGFDMIIAHLRTLPANAVIIIQNLGYGSGNIERDK